MDKQTNNLRPHLGPTANFLSWEGDEVGRYGRRNEDFGLEKITKQLWNGKIVLCFDDIKPHHIRMFRDNSIVTGGVTTRKQNSRPGDGF